MNNFKSSKVLEGSDRFRQIIYCSLRLLEAEFSNASLLLEVKVGNAVYLGKLHKKGEGGLRSRVVFRITLPKASINNVIIIIILKCSNKR